jgi:hypothetical protein
MALALVGQARGAAAAAAAAAEQQARLRQVHALKQLGQSQVGCFFCGGLSGLFATFSSAFGCD